MNSDLGKLAGLNIAMTRSELAFGILTRQRVIALLVDNVVGYRFTEMHLARYFDTTVDQ